MDFADIDRLLREDEANALRSIRATWLEQLTELRAAMASGGDDDDVAAYLLDCAVLDGWIKRLRRQVGAKATPDEVRAQTRDRVRRHRLARQVTPPPSPPAA